MELCKLQSRLEWKEIMSNRRSGKLRRAQIWNKYILGGKEMPMNWQNLGRITDHWGTWKRQDDHYKNWPGTELQWWHGNAEKQQDMFESISNWMGWGRTYREKEGYNRKKTPWTPRFLYKHHHLRPFTLTQKMTQTQRHEHEEYAVGELWSGNSNLGMSDSTEPSLG